MRWVQLAAKRIGVTTGEALAVAVTVGMILGWAASMFQLTPP